MSKSPPVCNNLQTHGVGLPEAELNPLRTPESGGVRSGWGSDVTRVVKFVTMLLLIPTLQVKNYVPISYIPQRVPLNNRTYEIMPPKDHRMHSNSKHVILPRCQLSSCI